MCLETLSCGVSGVHVVEFGVSDQLVNLLWGVGLFEVIHDKLLFL